MLLCKSYVKRKILLKHCIAVNGDSEHAVFCGRNGASEGTVAAEIPKSCGAFPGSQNCSACPKKKAACEEDRLGSCCQLGKPALGSGRRAGMVPSPALSPLMEEQLATLNTLAGDLQSKAFSGMSKAHSPLQPRVPQGSLLLCKGTPHWQGKSED